MLQKSEIITNKRERIDGRKKKKVVSLEENISSNEII